MKSYQVVAFGAPLAAADYPTPEPTGTEVLLRVEAAGVCHSDLHIWEGGYDLGGGRRLSLGDRGIRLPLTLGHETVGEVVALGPDATGVAIGARRLIYPWIGCGRCAACAEGNENLCVAPRFLGVYRDGGYSDHILVPHPRYLLDIDGLDPAAAAPYACSGLTTYSALKKAGPLIRQEPIVVIGAGGLGLNCLALLKGMGGVGAIVIDIDERKRRAALAAGALAAIDGRAPDAAAAIAAVAKTPIRAVIDLVGSEQTATLGFTILAKGGKLIVVGLFGGELAIPLPLIPMRALTIQGSYVGNLAELGELLDLVRRTGVTPIPLARRALPEATSTLEELKDGKLVGRAVLTPIERTRALP